MFRVVILDHSFTNVDLERNILEPLGAEILEYQCADPQQAAKLAKDADAVLVTNFATLTAQTIAVLDHCKVIVKHGIGMDIVDVDAASRKGIMVANLPDYCLNEVAEHAVTLLLASGRKVVEADRMTRKYLDHRLYELRPIKAFHQSTVGIVGFGRIGKLTAEKLANIFGEIVFFDPFVKENVEICGKICRCLALKELCVCSDFIIIEAPFSGDNYHMFSDDVFQSMKKTPCIINVGRGELIDMEALLKALESGTVGGAALDVVEGMPPIERDHPLMNYHHVILTPHCGWYSEASYIRIQEDAAKEVKRVLEGRSPKAWYNRKLMEKYGTVPKNLV